MAMWWYDTFYTLLPYFYILIDRRFHLSFILYLTCTTGSCPECTDQPPTVTAPGGVLPAVAILNIGLACCTPVSL